MRLTPCPECTTRGFSDRSRRRSRSPHATWMRRLARHAAARAWMGFAPPNHPTKGALRPFRNPQVSDLSFVICHIIFSDVVSEKIMSRPILHVSSGRGSWVGTPLRGGRRKPPRRPHPQINLNLDMGKERVDGAERPSTLSQVWSIRLAVASIPQSVNEGSEIRIRGTLHPRGHALLH